MSSDQPTESTPLILAPSSSPSDNQLEQTNLSTTTNNQNNSNNNNNNNNSHAESTTNLQTQHSSNLKKLQSRTRTLTLMLSILLSSLGIYFYNSSTSNDLINELASSIENLSTCASCKALLIPLISIAHLGDQKFYDTLVTFCTRLNIQDPQVCRGALGAQAPIIAHSLRSISISGQTATLFCTKTFGLCEEPPVRDWLGIPLPPFPIKSSSTNNLNVSSRHQTNHHRRRSVKKPIQVIHLSDLHIDRQYSIGADANCNRNLCCRTDQPTSTPNVTQSPAGPYGNHNCDSPESLYVSMLRALEEYASEAAFVVHTGDMVDHAVWNSVRREVEDGIGQGHSQFTTHSNKPLYGVIGNHDVAPTNSFPRNTTITTLSSQWDLELFADTWERWIGQQGSRSVSSMSGCFSRIHPGTNLKIISLNTGLWYKANFWLYDSDEFQPDPNGILTWLIEELKDSEEKGQKVWLMGHLSPGKSDCLRQPSRYLNQIMRRFKNTISASLFGHTHRSEWEIVYEDPRNPTRESAIGMIYIGPALTPESGNPAFRVYDVDPETYEILDFHEIITNLTEPGFQTGPRWFKYYSARETYGNIISEDQRRSYVDGGRALDGNFWHLVTEVLENSYPEFEKFYNRLTRGAGFKDDWRPCFSGNCRKKWVRNLRSSESEFNGYPNRVGLNIDSIESEGEDGDLYHHNHREGVEEDFGDEHVCGDLASLFKSAKKRFAHLNHKKVSH
ncbi:Metallo-dependent phosphatase-like protein [Phakopsora pachyrhizi]|uniref:Sphingomyelin phosphodiesterase n=1 Tax=Phakopsora pachyrhizi TaxID=170000 RepID=A0AAV0BK34_PHAPC|nr:Metallo-dependent phosphatase-like protein [Phakopsora pachyrhizi]CAH7686937.1 Metallo-dependent phosphatase-like protein [Phakopsora pachyrhizi]